jgi:hypothetical protein
MVHNLVYRKPKASMSEANTFLMKQIKVFVLRIAYCVLRKTRNTQVVLILQRFKEWVQNQDTDSRNTPAVGIFLSFKKVNQTFLKNEPSRTS